jgi:hypothetical protein
MADPLESKEWLFGAAFRVEESARDAAMKEYTERLDTLNRPRRLRRVLSVSTDATGYDDRFAVFGRGTPARACGSYTAETMRERACSTTARRSPRLFAAS